MHQSHPRRIVAILLAALAALIVTGAAAVAEPDPAERGRAGVAHVGAEEPSGAPGQVVPARRASGARPPRRPDAARGQYARRLVAIQWAPGDEDGPHFYMGTGKARREVSGADFYDTVGRPDLATTFRWRKGGGTVALVFAGIALNAALFVVVLDCMELDLFGTGADEWDSGCDNYEWADPAAAGLFLGSAGLSALGFALILNRDPLGDGRKPLLVHKHNLRLRHELGLPASAGNEPAGPTFSFEWAPFVAANGGGVHLVTRF